MKVSGIDFSLTGPSICVFDTSKEFKWSNVDCYYLTGTKKYVINNDTLHGDLIFEQPDNFHRYEYLKSWVYDKIQECDFILVEGFSFGSKGRAVFDIAEATGIMKQHIWAHNIQIETVPPKTIKKWYTDNGNAGKSDMLHTFKYKTGVDLVKMFGYEKSKIDSPIADCVDSFAILNYLLENYEFSS